MRVVHGVEKLSIRRDFNLVDFFRILLEIFCFLLRHRIMEKKKTFIFFYHWLILSVLREYMGILSKQLMYQM